MYAEHTLEYSDIVAKMAVVVVYEGKTKIPGNRPIEDLYKGIVERKNKQQGIKVVYPDDGSSFQWENVSAVLRCTDKFDSELARTRAGVAPSAFVN